MRKLKSRLLKHSKYFIFLQEEQ